MQGETRRDHTVKERIEGTCVTVEEEPSFSFETLFFGELYCTSRKIQGGKSVRLTHFQILKLSYPSFNSKRFLYVSGGRC